MTLAAALQTARSSLANAALQSALISRNVASVDQAGYARRMSETVADSAGLGVNVAVKRIIEDALRDAALEAGARAEGAQTLLAGLDRLDVVVGARSGDDTLPALLGALRDSLTAYGNDPSRAALGEAAVRAAGDVAARLNRLSDAATQLRDRADQDIAASVANVNTLLGRFKTADADVVAALATGKDPSDAQDERDALLAALSKEIGVTARPQRNGGLALYADGGLVLYDREPRRVEFTRSGPLVAGASGGAVMIDGVDATSQASTMAVGVGRIAALIALRDDVGVRMQAQADETARALVANFSESDQSALPVAPTLAGLFVDPRTTGVPDAVAAVGLAARLAVNANADPARGGDVTRLRDGGVGDPFNPVYRYNATGHAGFETRLVALADSFGSLFAFDPGAGLPTNVGLADFAVASLDWTSGRRAEASASAQREQAVRDRTVESLSNSAGVNVDEEMSRLLEVERAYQASAKLMSTIDEMFATLLQAVR
ncbi:MAG: flagellar hook-associated protein FlgK [Methylobacteriaceae bacterium]|nr:flagellar hook-associated protein FlgK [Methylobacteriaceae bacterium]